MVLYFTGAVLETVCPVAFFMPTHIPIASPVSEAARMVLHRQLFTQWQAVCWAFLLADLSIACACFGILLLATVSIYSEFADN